MSELETLERQRSEIAGRISAIQTAAAEEKSATFVGRYFKYRNSYSCPQGEADYWWLYFKATAYDGQYLTGYSFQHTTLGRFELDPTANVINYLDGYEEIDAKEFVRARAKFISNLLAVVK